MKTIFSQLMALLKFGISPLYAIPTLDDFKNYVVDRSGEPEVIQQPLYDFQLYPTAGQALLTFFSAPQGQGITSSLGAAVGSAKVITDTNMVLGSQLPSPQGFLITALEVRFIPGRSAAANTFLPAVPSQAAAVAAAVATIQLDDSLTVLESGALILNVQSKDYLTFGPLANFPPLCYFDFHAALGNSDTTTHNEVAAIAGRAMGEKYVMGVPISLTANANFNVRLVWPGAVATPSGFNARIGVTLYGNLFRNSQ